MDKALANAVVEITTKEEKQQKNKQKRNKKSGPGTLGYEDITCKTEKLQKELEEGKKTTILKSPLLNRKFQRREAVSEKNETERVLVKSTLKNYIQGENLSMHDLK